MKRRTFKLVLAGGLLLLLAAGIFLLRVGRAFDGEVNAFPGVTMTAVEGTASSTGITVEVLNTTDLEIESGDESIYGLQVELNGRWHTYRPKPWEDVASTMMALIYSPDEPVQLAFHWKKAYGPLWPGHYRVTKWFSAEQPSGGHTDFLLAAEFTLG